jgi:hypothetical protein
MLYHGLEVLAPLSSSMVHAKRWTRFPDVDIPRCVRIMTNAGYRGYFAAEYEEQGDGPRVSNLLDPRSCAMYVVHMAIKTVSLKTEAYERLRSARRYPGESFSEVILRARWPEDTLTGREMLRRGREDGAHFSETELDRMEAVRAADAPAVDKWTTR